MLLNLTLKIYIIQSITRYLQCYVNKFIAYFSNGKGKTKSELDDAIEVFLLTNKQIMQFMIRVC